MFFFSVYKNRKAEAIVCHHMWYRAGPFGQMLFKLLNYQHLVSLDYAKLLEVYAYLLWIYNGIFLFIS